MHILTKSKAISDLLKNGEGSSKIELIEKIKRLTARRVFNLRYNYQYGLDQNMAMNILQDQESSSYQVHVNQEWLTIEKSNAAQYNGKPGCILRVQHDINGKPLTDDIILPPYSYRHEATLSGNLEWRKNIVNYYITAWNNLKKQTIADLRSSIDENSIEEWKAEKEAARTSAVVQMAMAAGKLKDELESYQKQIIDVQSMAAAEKLADRIDSSANSFLYLRRKLAVSLKASFKVPAKKTVDKCMAKAAKVAAKKAAKKTAGKK